MPKRIWTQNEIDFMVNAFNAGYMIEEIAKKLGTKRQKVSKVLTDAGLEIVKARRNNRRLIHNYFETIDSEEKAYFLGLIFTDGNVMDGGKGRSSAIRIELSEEDEYILQQFQYEIQSDSTISHNKRANRENGTVRICIRSETMAKDLSKYGIVPNKTYITDRLPSNIPEEYIPAFIRGLIDGDGSIYSSNDAWHISFTTHFRSVAEDFERICSGLIGKEKHLTPTEHNGVYKVTYNGKYASELARVCYSNATIGLFRKLRRAVEAINESKTG